MQDKEEMITEEAAEYKPKNKYEAVLLSVYRNKTLSEILHIASYVIVFLTAYAFLWQLFQLIEREPLAIVRLLLITGVPFLAVSVLRRVINAPRPYELFEFYEKKPKGKAGRSFPSRHVFSVFVIAAVILPSNIFVGIGLLLLGAVLAAIRVLLGIHFIRDVAAGALIGVLCGIIGVLTQLI